MMTSPLDATQQRTLHAAIDRIIPPDDFSGAWDAGVGDYIAMQLSGDLQNIAQWFLDGLLAMDAEAMASAGQPLADLPADKQDAVLSRIERGNVKSTWPTPPAQFFAMLVNLTMEGFYSDPGNGGNRDEISWKMMGYQPRGQTRKAP